MRVSAVLFVLLFFAAPFSFALEKPESELQAAGITTKLGSQVDMSSVFTDAEGRTAPLSALEPRGVPTIVVPAYYDCPRLCGLVLDGVTKLIREATLTLGTDYRIVTVSIDPSETPPLAKKRQDFYLEELRKTGNPTTGFHFLTGDETNVRKVMQAIGFNYERDGEEFAHSAAIMILTPEGEVSQYFTGIEYPAWDVKLAMVEASQGRIGSALDHVLLYCFRFDPTKGKYTWVAFTGLRITGVLTLFFLGGLMFTLWRKERAVRDRRHAPVA